MARICRTVRLSYEAKYWIDRMIVYRTEELQKSIREDNLLERIESRIFEISNEKDLNGVSVSISLAVTVGSVIEEAIRLSRGLSLEDWQNISKEAEQAKKHINGNNEVEATPRFCIDEKIFREIEDLQIALRGDSPRVARMSYIIKLAVYNLFKKYNING